MDNMNNGNPAYQSVFNVDKESKTAFYGKVFLYFGLGILVSGLFSIIIGPLFDLLMPMYDYGDGVLVMSGPASTNYMIISIILFIALFATSIWLGMSSTRSGKAAVLPYVIYCALMGSFLALISCFINNPYLIGSTLLITSLMFLLMCGLGFIAHQKINLFFRVLIVLGVGLGLLSLCNFVIFPVLLFGGNSALYQSYISMYWISEGVIFLIFLIMTIIDMARIKSIAETGANSQNLALYCAVILYSDFINIFMYVLRFLILIMANKDN